MGSIQGHTDVTGPESVAYTAERSSECPDSADVLSVFPHVVYLFVVVPAGRGEREARRA